MKHLAYLIYIILYETLIIGGCAYVVFALGHSGWWFLLAAFFGAAAYPPERFIYGVVKASEGAGE